MHVLIDCPRLRGLRQKLRRRIGNRFNNISMMLGGKPPAPRDGAADKEAAQLAWQIPKKELEAVLEFADKSGRFRARTLRIEL